MSRSRRSVFSPLVVLSSPILAMAVLILPFEASAQFCADPSSGWRGCDTVVDTDCAGDLRANYYSFDETLNYLYELDIIDDVNHHLTLIDLGLSYHDLETPIGAAAYPMVVARIAEDADNPEVDRPAILLVANVHPEEWIATEVALGYVDYLVQGAVPSVSDPDVLAILNEAEIWVVLNGNPAGRVFSDALSDGDPDQPIERQRKNLQWRDSFDCQSMAHDAYHSGDCKFGGNDWWQQNGVNIARNFSTDWGGDSSRPYARADMENYLGLGTTAYEEHPYIAPEEYRCDSTPGSTDCADNYPSHPHCEQRGYHIEYIPPFGIAVERADYGCFVAPAENDLADCVANLAGLPPDELGLDHYCIQTRVSSTDLKWLPWECGESDKIIDSSHPVGVFSFTSNHDLLGKCDNGVLRTCKTDAHCMALPVDDADFDPLSPHNGGDRYCTDAGYCAVSDHHTCCGPNYMGERPFDSAETRMIRRLIENIPFVFMLDLHSSRNDLTTFCKDKGNGCSGANEDRSNLADLFFEMIDAYNEGAEIHFGAALPLVLEMTPHGIHEPENGAGQLPPWAAGTTASLFADPLDPGGAISEQNFDKETYRGITAFTWELGTKKRTDVEDFVNPIFELGIFDEWVECVPGGNGVGLVAGRARSSIFLENQLAGGREMLNYLADQTATPFVSSDRTGTMFDVNRRDVSLAGLTIQDGRGRGIGQIESRSMYLWVRSLQD